MKREDLFALYGRLLFVLGVMVMAIALMVEHGPEPFPPRSMVSTAMVAPEARRIKPPPGTAGYSRSRPPATMEEFGWRPPQARLGSADMTDTNL